VQLIQSAPLQVNHWITVYSCVLKAVTPEVEYSYDIVGFSSSLNKRLVCSKALQHQSIKSGANSLNDNLGTI
jgi:hypothetical protein